jgi:hypothetical protein
MKILKPACFGHRECMGKKAEAKKANRVSAKYAIFPIPPVTCGIKQAENGEGSAKKNRRTPPVNLLNPRPIRHPIFFLVFFNYASGRFLARGVQKHHTNNFSQLKKVHVENFSQTNRQKFRCQFFLDFFVLSRFRAFLSDGSSKTLKTKCKKHRVK